MPRPAPPDIAGRLRAGLRGAALALLLSSGLLLLLAVRLVERPLCGLRRPVTPWITQGVCRGAVALAGLRYSSSGAPMRAHGVVVSNHASWLDILALNVRKRIYFVSKSEVRDWPAVGWLARATGAVFITRDPRDAGRQRALFAARLKAGHKLLFFPEGTSTDGRRVLPFRPTLFAALFETDLRDETWVQPVTLVYTAPEGADPRFYAWWGGMDFAPHVLQVLAAPRRGAVEVIYHPLLRVADHPDRKALARAAEATVRAALQARLPAAQAV